VSGRPDAIVVGAGIVGAFCARELAAAGLSVLVLERGIPAGATTATGMGHLVVLDDSEAEMALCAASLELWEALAPELPAVVEDEPRGTLWMAADEEEMAFLPAKRDTYRARGLPAEILGPRELAEAEPALAPDLAGGLLVPRDRVLYPMSLVPWLLDRLAAEGSLLLRTGVEVAALDGAGVELADGERLEAGLVVNAAGPWAGELTPGLSIRPRRGHLVITDRYPGMVNAQLVELGYLESAHQLTAESVAANVQPRATGQLLVGSSRELVGWDATINRPLLARMLARCRRYVPALAGLSILRIWVGFRPATPDKLPYIGRMGEDGPWVAAGHEGLGITLATGTARLLADLVLGRDPLVDPGPYDPSRPMPDAGREAAP